MFERQITFEKIFRQEEGDQGGDLFIQMAFASEEPADRWWGIEILDMGKKSVRLERLNDGANILFNHDPDELRGTHVSGSVKIGKDRVLRGQVRLEGATQAGRDTQALVESGHLTKASIGYLIHKVLEENVNDSGEKQSREIKGSVFEGIVKRTLDSHGKERSFFYRELDRSCGRFSRANGNPSVFRVIDWEPFENSLVTIPVDATVGVGRSFNQTAEDAINKGEAMKENIKESPTGEAGGTAKETKGGTGVVTDLEELKEKHNRKNADELEKGRIEAINNLCKTNRLDEGQRKNWINQGLSLEEVAKDIVRIYETREKENQNPVTKIGLSPNEINSFSLSRAIYACGVQNWNKAGFELECTRAIAEKLNKAPEPNKFYVPFEVLQRPLDVSAMLGVDDRHLTPAQRLARRDLTVDTAGAGGYLVGTDNIGFIDILRNRSVAVRMGVRVMSGLVGNITIPRQSAAATAYWLATEATAITESQQTFVQVALSPKNVGAYTELSRQLLLQSSPGAEGIVTDDLARVLAIAGDLAVLDGQGTEQPTGIIGTSGIGAVTGTSLGYVGVLNFQEDVATANVMPMRGGYVTTPAVASFMMQRVKFTNTASPLWEGNLWDGMMVGFQAMSSNQMPASTMLFGDWSEAILAEWGVLEVEVNPVANFPAGIIGVRAFYSMDVGVRIPAAFSLASSIT